MASIAFFDFIFRCSPSEEQHMAETSLLSLCPHDANANTDEKRRRTILNSRLKYICFFPPPFSARSLNVASATKLSKEKHTPDIDHGKAGFPVHFHFHSSDACDWLVERGQGRSLPAQCHDEWISFQSSRASISDLFVTFVRLGRSNCLFPISFTR